MKLNPGKLFDPKLFTKYSSVFYFIGASFAGAILGFLLLPLFTHYLQKEDFAIVGFASAFNAFIAPLFNLALASYYIKAYNEEPITPRKKARLITSLIVMSIAWSMLMLVLFTALGNATFQLAKIRIPFSPYVPLLMVTNVLQIPITLYLLELRMQRQLLGYFFVSLAVSVCSILIPLAFVVYFSSSAFGRLAGFAVSYVPIAIYAIIKLWPSLKFDLISKEVLIKALKFSAPLIPYTIFYLLFDFVDKYFVEQYNSDLKILGYYNIGFQFANILFVFANALYRAYEPTYYKLFYEGNYKRLCKMYDLTIYAILGSGMMMIVLLPTIVDLLTSKDYSLSVVMGRWLILISIVQSIGMVYGTQFSITGKTFHLMVMGGGALLLYCIVGYFFSRSFSYQGTIWAKLIVQSVFVSSAFLFYRKTLSSSKAVYLTLFLLAIVIYLLLVLH